MMRKKRERERERFPLHTHAYTCKCVSVRTPSWTNVRVSTYFLVEREGEYMWIGVNLYVCVCVCIRGPSARFHRHRGWIGNAHAPTAENLPSQVKSATETRRACVPLCYIQCRVRERSPWRFLKIAPRVTARETKLSTWKTATVGVPSCLSQRKVGAQRVAEK